MLDLFIILGFPEPSEPEVVNMETVGVEVAAVAVPGGRGALIAIRDSKDRDGVKLISGLDSWAGFLRKAKAGNFDLV